MTPEQRAIVDRLEHALRTGEIGQPPWLETEALDVWDIIKDACRAGQRAGAEAMRERAARAVEETEQVWLGRVDWVLDWADACDGTATLEAAAANVRALPVEDEGVPR